jgi:hypothetical protein
MGALEGEPWRGIRQRVSHKMRTKAGLARGRTDRGGGGLVRVINCNR